MRTIRVPVARLGIGAAVIGLLGGATMSVRGQDRTATAPRSNREAAPRSARTAVPRTSEGKPDFSGIWQAMTTANWDLQTHAARQGPLTALGAAFSVPGGLGVVDGEELPYLPGAAARKQANAEHWLTADPEITCFLPGVPRMMYMPYPMQVFQELDTVLIASEFNSASRTIRMNSQEKSPADTWMGWSIGHWDGDTLVVQSTDFNDQTWFDRAGNYHSEQLTVLERFTLADRNTIAYEATMTDPKVFSRPWTIRLPLYRRLEKNARLMDYKCAEFAEELRFGHLRPSKP